MKKSVDIERLIEDNANIAGLSSLKIKGGIMAVPVIKKEQKTKEERNFQAKENRRIPVRPRVKQLIEQGIKENAPTWAELANR